MSNVKLVEREGLGIAAVLVRKGQDAALAARLRQRFGVALVDGPHRAVAGDFALLGTGPGAWFAVQERGGNALAASLRTELAGLASVSDQSDGYRVWRLSGRDAREVLSRVVSIDFHDQAFKVGQVASTLAGHVGVTVWRLEDASPDSPVYELAVYRSYAESFLHGLHLAA